MTLPGVSGKDIFSLPEAAVNVSPSLSATAGAGFTTFSRPHRRESGSTDLSSRHAWWIQSVFTSPRHWRRVIHHVEHMVLSSVGVWEAYSSTMASSLIVTPGFGHDRRTSNCHHVCPPLMKAPFEGFLQGQIVTIVAVSCRCPGSLWCPFLP